MDHEGTLESAFWWPHDVPKNSFGVLISVTSDRRCRSQIWGERNGSSESVSVITKHRPLPQEQGILGIFERADAPRPADTPCGWVAASSAWALQLSDAETSRSYREAVTTHRRDEGSALISGLTDVWFLWLFLSILFSASSILSSWLPTNRSLFCLPLLCLLSFVCSVNGFTILLQTLTTAWNLLLYPSTQTPFCTHLFSIQTRPSPLLPNHCSPNPWAGRDGRPQQ